MLKRPAKRQKLGDEEKEEIKRRKEQERLDKLKAKEEERLEKERLKEQERLEKERIKEQERLEKERIKEQERLKREEVKEQERLKREEDLAKKAEEKRKKEEEKEEERKKKEEEKRVKDEEKRVKEEERKKQLDEKEKERLKIEEKKAKQAQHFTKFFQKSPASVTKVRTLEGGDSPITARQRGADTECDKENKAVPLENEVIEPLDKDADLQVVMVKKAEAPFFTPMPFQIKTHMAVAPIIRRNLALEERTILDKCFQEEEKEANMTNSAAKKSEDGQEYKLDFFKTLKTRESRKSGKTKVEYEETDLDNPVVIEEDHQEHQPTRQCRWKLVQFHDNRRPAYWGTWITKPLKISGRRPFAKEEELDYEFDSDDEWEDEPEDAEEIENSDGEEELEDPTDGEPVDEDDEEGWMVPHGYLSDTEREGEQMDLETAKSKEKEFYQSLKEQVKMGLPVIQTEDLSEFELIFPLFPPVVVPSELNGEAELSAEHEDSDRMEIG